MQDAQKGRPARPQRVKARGVPSGYVEGLNEARTTLADFFSILSGLPAFWAGSRLFRRVTFVGSEGKELLALPAGANFEVGNSLVIDVGG